MGSKKYVLGICGGSGSGKSYMVKKIQSHFTPGLISVLDQDSYYKDLSYLPPADRMSMNFDHPDAIDFNQLSNDINQIISGEAIKKPLYDFNSHTRIKDKGLSVKPSPVIIIEGHHIFNYDQIINKMDFKIFLDIESDIRFIRRLTRDIKERGRDVESVIQQYLNTVRPMELKFVHPAKKHADIVINSINYKEKFSDIVKLLQGFLTT